MFARDQQAAPFKEQWDRVGRWFAKTKAAYANGTQADEMMDLFFTTFQNLFFMRDWFLRSGVDKQKVTSLFAKQNLRLCRDIANGTKHCFISCPSVDANFRTFREYDPTLVEFGFRRVEAFKVGAGGHLHDMYRLMVDCFSDIHGFLVRERLHVAKSVAPCDMMTALPFNPNELFAEKGKNQ